MGFGATQGGLVSPLAQTRYLCVCFFVCVFSIEKGENCYMRWALFLTLTSFSHRFLLALSTEMKWERCQAGQCKSGSSVILLL